MRNFRSILALAIMLVSLSCYITTIPEIENETEPYYTAHNIWFENPKIIYAINFKVGAMIPAGTRAYRFMPGIGKFEIFEFSIEGFNERIALLINPSWQPGLSEKELFNRSFSHNTFDELTNGLTKKEIDAIRNGTVFVGMSRKAVEISYGYPPLHRTPFYNKTRTWKYWLTRHDTQMIVFDSSWKVIQIIN